MDFPSNFLLMHSDVLEGVGGYGQGSPPTKCNSSLQPLFYNFLLVWLITSLPCSRRLWAWRNMPFPLARAQVRWQHTTSAYSQIDIHTENIWAQKWTGNGHWFLSTNQAPSCENPNFYWAASAIKCRRQIRWRVFPLSLINKVPISLKAALKDPLITLGFYLSYFSSDLKIS